MRSGGVFTIKTPVIAFGSGALDEAGSRARASGMRHAALFSDPGLANGPLMQRVAESLESAGVAVTKIADLEVEPTDHSFKKATDDLRYSGADGVISLGGGSVIDTAKAANLYASAPAHFERYVNAPLGEGAQPDRPLMPHIACPTTCGTGSEATGIAVFDDLARKSKTGIMSPALVPDIALIDPEVTRSLPLSVLTATALDALSHALEAYTCRAFQQRDLPSDPDARPMTQGANPWSDIIAEQAIRCIAAHMRPALDEHAQGEGADTAARGQLMWAASLAGNAFGNAGCHIPHALSYPISGMVRDYRPADWPPGPPLIPHGLSVLLTAPAVYRLTGPGDPFRHGQVARWLGLTPSFDDEAGERIAAWVEDVMQSAGLPRTLREIGYAEDDIAALTAGALPQRRLLDNAPIELGEAEVARLFCACL